MSLQKCECCKGELEAEKLKYNIVIPESILLLDAGYLIINSTYVRNYNNFCDEECYNLSLLDKLINRYGFFLMSPENNFFDIEKDVPQAKETLRELQDFKTEYAN
ncbi:hypothetical protein ABE036_18110 [Priestia aryabhattai]|uniref:hypothetical protein n=1 Tax=Priestia TaxID=2800373 RepID=UPI000D523952|nr:hypothetical protein [Priestia megaterium]PVE74431.1 hypothetical protein DC428_00545 [Priestia megaterium]PVE82366.1 hypothetical protein DC421_19735 [Priestia megaterium]PVE86952.1 hypothetical protein DC426_16740 [Priestia megaterium]PVE97893.1 hypothetical protein DC433_17410 [Priestia megaterium]